MRRRPPRRGVPSAAPRPGPLSPMTRPSWISACIACGSPPERRRASSETCSGSNRNKLHRLRLTRIHPGRCSTASGRSRGRAAGRFPLIPLKLHRACWSAGAQGVASPFSAMGEETFSTDEKAILSRVVTVCFRSAQSRSSCRISTAAVGRRSACQDNDAPHSSTSSAARIARRRHPPRRMRHWWGLRARRECGPSGRLGRRRRALPPGPSGESGPRRLPYRTRARHDLGVGAAPRSGEAARSERSARRGASGIPPRQRVRSEQPPNREPGARDGASASGSGRGISSATEHQTTPAGGTPDRRNLCSIPRRANRSTSCSTTPACATS